VGRATRFGTDLIFPHAAQHTVRVPATDGSPHSPPSRVVSKISNCGGQFETNRTTCLGKRGVKVYETGALAQHLWVGNRKETDPTTSRRGELVSRHRVRGGDIPARGWRARCVSASAVGELDSSLTSPLIHSDRSPALLGVARMSGICRNLFEVMLDPMRARWGSDAKVAVSSAEAKCGLGFRRTYSKGLSTQPTAS